MGLDYITLGKACGARNRKKRRKPEEMLTFRGCTYGTRYAHRRDRDVRKIR